MDINYELYKVFYYVASSLSFSEASKQLYISQSAVSQSIKALEKKLDQVLFIRSTKKVQLTPEGEILLRHVEPAMNLIKRGENQLLESNSIEPVIPSAVTSLCLIWNAFTGVFRPLTLRSRTRHPSSAWISWKTVRWI